MSIHDRPSRRGAVLLITVALASMLLVVMTAFLARMRNTAESMWPVMQETQCRLMLHAALMYLQETSRLGWGEECYGWTDIRDGSLGPRGPRDPVTNRLPVPAWMPATHGTLYDTTGTNGFPEDTALPGQPTWPCPGAVLRIATAVWQEPPHAIQVNAAPNPIFTPLIAELNWSAYTATFSSSNINNRNVSNLVATGITNNPASWNLLDPQPVADTWARACQGDRTPRPTTSDRAWFRIYRERLRDHDARPDPNDIWSEAVPQGGGSAVDLDQVAVSEEITNNPNNPKTHGTKNWNVFILTVGAGASRGFRDWGEVQRANATYEFAGNERMFRAARMDERIQWWRVEWSADQGGGYDPQAFEGFLAIKSGQLDTMRTRPQYRSKGGCFKWIQRLDRAPEVW